MENVADASVVGPGVIPVRVHYFPTARPVAVDRAEPEMTPDGRTRAIEFLLANSGDPGLFERRREWFDVRAEAGPGVEWPGLDLAGDDLGGFDLRGANLTGARIGECGGSDLRHARLDRVQIREAQGSLFDFAEMHEAILDFGRFEGASFAGAFLGGASFRDASLRRASFTGADLTQADFHGVDLTGSDIQFAVRAAGADFSEAEGLTLEQRQALARLGATGLGSVLLAPLLDREFTA